MLFNANRTIVQWVKKKEENNNWIKEKNITVSIFSDMIFQNYLYVYKTYIYHNTIFIYFYYALLFFFITHYTYSLLDIEDI